MRCKTCGYLLNNLTEHRCPKCGRAFDPTDPKSFSSGGATKLRRWFTRPALRAILYAPLLVWFYWTLRVLFGVPWEGLLETLGGSVSAGFILVLFYWWLTPICIVAMYLLFVLVEVTRRRRTLRN